MDEPQSRGPNRTQHPRHEQQIKDQYHAEKGVTTDMTWTENSSRQMNINDARVFIEERFKGVYPFEEKNGTVLFTLPDGFIMKVVSLGSKFNALVMDYTSSFDSDDGDTYRLEDFETPDAMFEAMLEETRL